MVVYRVSSYDPLRGLSNQSTDHLLVTSVEAGERWIRNIYESVGAANEVGPLHRVGHEPLWTMDASVGRIWFIALAVVHHSDCPLLAQPSNADAPRCICEPKAEHR